MFWIKWRLVLPDSSMVSISVSHGLLLSSMIFTNFPMAFFVWFYGVHLCSSISLCSSPFLFSVFFVVAMFLNKLALICGVAWCWFLASPHSTGQQTRTSQSNGWHLPASHPHHQKHPEDIPSACVKTLKFHMEHGALPKAESTWFKTSRFRMFRVVSGTKDMELNWVINSSNFNSGHKPEKAE